MSATEALSTGLWIVRLSALAPFGRSIGLRLSSPLRLIRWIPTGPGTGGRTRLERGREPGLIVP